MIDELDKTVKYKIDYSEPSRVFKVTLMDKVFDVSHHQCSDAITYDGIVEVPLFSRLHLLALQSGNFKG